MADKATWLSKLGSILKGVAPLIPVVGGILATVIPGTKDDVIIHRTEAQFSSATDVVADLTTIVSLFEAGGQALNLTGPQKLQMASGPAAKVLLASAIFAGKKISDPELFNQGAAKVAGGLADCWHAVDPESVETEKA